MVAEKKKMLTTHSIFPHFPFVQNSLVFSSFINFYDNGKGLEIFFLFHFSGWWVGNENSSLVRVHRLLCFLWKFNEIFFLLPSFHEKYSKRNFKVQKFLTSFFISFCWESFFSGGKSIKFTFHGVLESREELWTRRKDWRVAGGWFTPLWSQKYTRSI